MVSMLSCLTPDDTQIACVRKAEKRYMRYFIVENLITLYHY